AQQRRTDRVGAGPEGPRDELRAPDLRPVRRTGLRRPVPRLPRGTGRDAPPPRRAEHDPAPVRRGADRAAADAGPAPGALRSRSLVPGCASRSPAGPAPTHLPFPFTAPPSLVARSMFPLRLRGALEASPSLVARSSVRAAPRPPAR